METNDLFGTRRSQAIETVENTLWNQLPYATPREMKVKAEQIVIALERLMAT